MEIRCKAKKLQVNGRSAYIGVPPEWRRQFGVVPGQFLIPSIAEDGSLVYRVTSEEVAE